MLKLELEEAIQRLINRFQYKQGQDRAMYADILRVYKDVHINIIFGAITDWNDNNDKFPSFASLSKLIEKQIRYSGERNKGKSGLGYSLDEHCKNNLCTAILEYSEKGYKLCIEKVSNNPYYCNYHAAIEQERINNMKKDNLLCKMLSELATNQPDKRLAIEKKEE